MDDLEEVLSDFPSQKKSLFYLILGFILSIFSLGIFNIPILIFIWPYLFIYYLHNEKNIKKGIPLVCAALVVSNLIKWIGYSNVNFGIDLVLGLYNSIISVIPFIVEGLTYNKIDKWRNVLLFPLVVSTTEFLFSFIPISNGNCFAYSQVENTVLSQMISLFGMYSLSFLIALFASLIDYTFVIYKNEKRITKGIYIYIIVLVIFHIYGGIYLQIHPNNEKIKVASSIGLSPIDSLKDDEHIRPLNEYIEYIEKKTIKAKAVDCKLINFAEEAFYINIKDYENIVKATMEIAKENDIFISIGLDIDLENGEDCKNMNVFINNKGERLYEYSKHHPIPVAESEYIKGRESIKILNTSIGKITTVICYDINFGYFMNYIGFKHPDIVIVPSWDYKAVAVFQSQGARFKALENGYNIIKNTAAGVTLTCDYQGRILGYYRADETEDYFVVSDVYVKGVKTLYSFIGIFFNYFYIIGIVVVIFFKRK